MIRSLLIGLVAGLRSMTPFAAVAFAARNRRLNRKPDETSLLASRTAVAGASVLAAGELLGDKMRSAPDRTIPPGLVARLITGAVAGAALAPRRDRLPAAVLGALGAVAGGYVGLAVRKRAMARYGQTRSGLVEDGFALAATAVIVGWPRNDLGDRRHALEEHQK